MYVHLTRELQNTRKKALTNGKEKQIQRGNGRPQLSTPSHRQDWETESQQGV